MKHLCIAMYSVSIVTLLIILTTFCVQVCTCVLILTLPLLDLGTVLPLASGDMICCSVAESRWLLSDFREQATSNCCEKLCEKEVEVS